MASSVRGSWGAKTSSLASRISKGCAKKLRPSSAARQRFCQTNNVPGCLRETIQELSIPEFTKDLGKTWQTSIGMAHQVGGTMSVERSAKASAGFAVLRDRSDRPTRGAISAGSRATDFA